MQPEFRKDYLQDRYVLIAPLSKKDRFEIERPEVLNHGETTPCPFCTAQSNKQLDELTLGPKKNWYVKVLQNKDAALTIENPKAFGRQEVIIETPHHITQLDKLPVEHIEQVLKAYAMRLRALSKDDRFEYLMLSKTHGGQCSHASGHSHSQLLATSFVSPLLIDRSKKALEYKLKNGSCATCDLIKKERAEKRIIFEDDSIIAFAPYASFTNYEAWVLPKAHRQSLADLNNDERASLASILKHLLTGITQLHLPYRYAIQHLPSDQNQHLCLTVSPRGSVWAGSDYGTEFPVNHVAPKDAAAFYRHGL